MQCTKHGSQSEIKSIVNQMVSFCLLNAFDLFNFSSSQMNYVNIDEMKRNKWLMSILNMNQLNAFNVLRTMFSNIT